MKRLGLLVFAAGLVAAMGCPGQQGPSSPSGPTRTPTNTFTVTDSPTLAPTATSTSTPSDTPTATITPTRTRTSTRTRTLTPTITLTETQTQTPWPGVGTGLRGDYYNGEAFNTAVLTRVDPVIHFELFSGSPDPSVDADHFSAKWTGEVQAPYSGPITFITISDDGVRLWVDGTLVIDNYSSHSYTQDEGVLTLTAGQKYPIELHYYESTGSAIMNLGWKAENIPSLFIATEFLYPATSSPPTSTPSDTPTITATPTITMTPTITFTPTVTGTPWPGTGTGLRGDYYNEVDFSQFVLTREDPQIDFDFGTGTSPAPSVEPVAYSIRWTGEVQAPNSGPITFVTNSDDGVRLWVDGTQIINDYSPHAAQLAQGVANLTAGQKYPIQMDYYQGLGGALISLGWKSDNVPTQVVPSQNLYPAPGVPTATATATFTPTSTFVPPSCPNLASVGVTTGDITSADCVVVANACALPVSATVYAVRVNATSAKSVILAIFSNDGSVPSTIISEAPPSAVSPGWNTVDIPDVSLPAGIYWLAILGYDRDFHHLKYDMGGPVTTVRDNFPACVSNLSMPWTISGATMIYHPAMTMEYCY